jgi:hypothetical protein
LRSQVNPHPSEQKREYHAPRWCMRCFFVFYVFFWGAPFFVIVFGFGFGFGYYWLHKPQVFGF